MYGLFSKENKTLANFVGRLWQQNSLVWYMHWLHWCRCLIYRRELLWNAQECWVTTWRCTSAIPGKISKQFQNLFFIKLWLCDMQRVSKQHFITIRAHSKLLESVKEKKSYGFFPDNKDTYLFIYGNAIFWKLIFFTLRSFSSITSPHDDSDHMYSCPCRQSSCCYY